ARRSVRRASPASRLADTAAPEQDRPRLNVLVAWPYVKPDVIRAFQDLGDDGRFLLDSGAFTAWKAGKKLALDDYCRFIDALPVRPWRYFALDVIGEPAATLRNYEAMLRRGYDPIPVFTRGEDPSVLDEYFRTSNVVGLGGVAKADKSAYAWTRWAMGHVRGRHVHILGFTNLEWVKYLRPYSVDSSSWSRVGRFGWLDVYLGQGSMSRSHQSRFDRVESFSSTYSTPGWQRAQAAKSLADAQGRFTGRTGSQAFGSTFAEGRGGFQGRLTDRSSTGRMIDGELVAKSTGQPSRHKIGDRVFHLKFGYGEVMVADGNKLTVQFDKAGEKKVVDSFVEAV
ncbi:MAG: hypothetical protein WCH83_18190, partial [Alphaproteobacteria bacterium]